MFKRKIAFIISFILLFSIALSQELSEEQILKNSPSYTKILTVNGREGLLYFAQNSPEWDNLKYSEAKYHRDKIFGQSSCIATSLSMALANIVPYTDLKLINSIVKEPIMVDSISTTRDRGRVKEFRFEITEDVDFLRFFPLVIGNWASGNNTKRIVENQSTYFYKILFELYGIDYIQTKDIKESFKVLDRGGIVIVSSGGVASPISKKGHYFLMVSYDKDYVYFLDPLVRSKPYPDVKKIIEQLDAGVIRVKQSDIKDICLNLQYGLYPLKNTPKYTQHQLDSIFKQSNNLAKPIAQN